METLSLPPRASALSESLRDLGYSLETAVSDIIDNALAASALNIDIWCDVQAEKPALAIVDDGNGMAKDVLIEAMRYGSKNPRETRSSTDLGRFGLGLKTASFSQCRKLTVISRRDGETWGAIWDLQVLAGDDWKISLLDEKECENAPWITQLQDRGTIVIWELLDRLTERKTDTTLSEILNEKLTILGNHISLVFHRFISGDGSKTRKTTMRINGHKVEGFDPFCRTNPATIPQPNERVQINGIDVNIQPFILPHHSKLSKAEFDFYRGRSDFLSNQGAYVYRNRRLMAWGDWFRLIPKGENTKLARVQIDFPSELDELWTIDIKKARAHPPHEVREKLKQIIGRITDQSSIVHTGKSRKLFKNDVLPMWSRYAVRGTVKYLPSFEHPLVATFANGLTEDQVENLKSILEAIGSSIPIEAIYSDYSVAPKDLEDVSTLETNEELYIKLQKIRSILDPEKTMTSEHFRRVIRSTRMLEGSENVLLTYLEKEFSHG